MLTNGQIETLQAERAHALHRCADLREELGRKNKVLRSEVPMLRDALVALEKGKVAIAAGIIAAAVEHLDRVTPK